VESEIARVNKRFGSDNWFPIVFKKGMVSQRLLAAFYSEADIACVTPLRDGMNLVAKEYVASQVDLTGALVLSRFAGAAEDLADCAELVNPNDPEEITMAIERTLDLGTYQRRARMANMRIGVRERNLSWWLDSISAYINSIRKNKIPQARKPHLGIERGMSNGLGACIPAD
jgi:trehalose 6-phosphate synthase